jgi:hypothetical protein
MYEVNREVPRRVETLRCAKVIIWISGSPTVHSRLSYRPSNVETYLALYRNSRTTSTHEHPGPHIRSSPKIRLIYMFLDVLGDHGHSLSLGRSPPDGGRGLLMITSADNPTPPLAGDIIPLASDTINAFLIIIFDAILSPSCTVYSPTCQLERRTCKLKLKLRQRARPAVVLGRTMRASSTQEREVSVGTAD